MAMNIGISSYSLSRKLYSQEMDLFQVMDWAKAHNCTHMEIVPFGLPLGVEEGKPDYEYAGKIRDYAKEIGLPLSAFSLNAHFIFSKEEAPTEEKKQELFDKEIERVKMYMNLAHEMGIKKFRNDTCTGMHPDGDNSAEQFEKDFPTLVKAVQILADYAATLGMSTTLENHGRFTNGSERVLRILKAANRPNIGLTVDVGNFLCVNEDPVVAVSKVIKYADMIHLKDFYIRDTKKMFPVERKMAKTPAEHKANQNLLPYVTTALADYQILRGAIVGQGDMDMWKIISVIKEAGYDKEISLEFEGMEDCAAGTYYGLEMAKYIWDRI